MKGKVWLVGAGPGDPELLTVKALRVIREADLLVYDYLANPEHLRHAREDAVKIGVGKGFRHRTLTQEKINRLIIEAAKKGKKVVRLKGGDPYLFGRGGEEALFLFERRIPFEVVPGVTSATACAAYAGIPLTHRDHNSSVTFLTGHKAHDENLDSVAWEKIVGLNGTLVIYMGFYNLAKIARRLIQNGMPPRTKTAVIEWGTLARQKSCDGTLRDIAGKVRQKKLGAPCIIIVGDVVGLRKKLDWFEKSPLFGKTALVTRTSDKIGFLKDKLSRLGADVIETPLIKIEPIRNFSEMDDAIRRLKNWDWVVFTSTYGAEAFFRRLKKRFGRDARALGALKIASVGPGTSLALKERGVTPDLEPPHFETRAIVREFRKRYGRLDGKNFLLFRTDVAPPDLERGLETLGAKVRRVTAYRTRFLKTLSADVQNRLLGGEIDFVTFTSSSTVTGFVRALGLKKAKAVSKKTRFISIGPVTSRTMRQNGLRVHAQAKIFTIDGLVNAVLSLRGIKKTP